VLDVACSYVRVKERIKTLFRRQPRQPPTVDELAARAEAEGAREQIRRNEAALKQELDARRVTDIPPF